MSELINTNDNRATIRWKLLTGVSALALTVYISSAAKAEDSRPLIWLDLAGQVEQIEGLSAPFTADFMAATPDPGSYSKSIFSSNQRPPRFSFGFDGSLSFQPEDSDWVFSAGIQYGRAHTNRHEHDQGPHPSATFYNNAVHHISTVPLDAAPLADAQMRDDVNHTILDFSAGRDFGIGMLGRNGDSTVSAGVRIAQFSTASAVEISARPNIRPAFRPAVGIVLINPPQPSFYQYFLTGDAARSFKGVGPSLSWNASAAIAGNAEDGELSLDWGINGAVLFGRQEANVSHHTHAYHLTQQFCKRFKANGSCAAFASGYPLVYHHPTNAPAYYSTRSRNVTVPNIGGFAALTARYRGAKVSIGYRYDDFLKAMDTGIDARKTSDLTFHGPYASISIGLGD